MSLITGKTSIGISFWTVDIVIILLEPEQKKCKAEYKQ